MQKLQLLVVVLAIVTLSGTDLRAQPDTAMAKIVQVYDDERFDGSLINDYGRFKAGDMLLGSIQSKQPNGQLHLCITDVVDARTKQSRIPWGDWSMCKATGITSTETSAPFELNLLGAYTAAADDTVDPTTTDATIFESKSYQVIQASNERLVIIPKTDIECFVAGPDVTSMDGNKFDVNRRNATLICQKATNTLVDPMSNPSGQR